MTSWFIGVKASVISGAPLYSKSISYLFPVGKRQVSLAKRSYHIEKFGFEPMRRQQKNDQPESIAFFSMVEHPRDVFEVGFLNFSDFILQIQDHRAFLIKSVLLSQLHIEDSETCLGIFKGGCKQ